MDYCHFGKLVTNPARTFTALLPSLDIVNNHYHSILLLVLIFFFICLISSRNFVSAMHNFNFLRFLKDILRKNRITIYFADKI